jgi:CubicO group peptidase (beta-lactamase class C family)
MNPYATAGAALFLFTALPAFAAPDEDMLGKKQGYPSCKLDGKTFAPPDCVVWLMSHYQVAYPARAVKKGAETRPLKRAADPGLPLDAFLAEHRNTGLLVMNGDAVLAERYQYDRRPEHLFNSMSMAKTVVGMLVGIALSESRIKSIDDRADQYVAGLKGHPYGETPIRHLLTMSSGVKFVEAYNGNDDIMKLARVLLLHQGPGGPQALEPFRERVAPPGKQFSYASSETYVLALVLRAATGRNVSEYLSEKIWQPMGAEADAAWNIDAAGYELGYCCLSATLRDWGRFGLLLAEGGARGGKQINRAPMTGYGYQTWVSPQEDRFQLRGLRGQAIDIHPASKTVVVHTGVYGVMAGNQGQYSFFNTVLTALNK